MDFLFITLGINIFIVFLLRRQWLLNKKPFLILFAFNLLLFALAYILKYNRIGNPDTVVALKIPALFQVMFLGFVSIFRKIYGRDPKDTFWTMDKSLMKDGVFNFIFLVSAIIPILLVFSGLI